ncbi:hypothetical protein CDAR_615881 [Caerostris darwini]|uniref:Uncharacterized protein n=1 Tax=Caerostris darwini TaxID=1538125 RepID=A0AAV4RV58_9ARAC|nr:hypothetical protein CDAR_615881 [Caerostris darwini]
MNGIAVAISKGSSSLYAGVKQPDFIARQGSASVCLDDLKASVTYSYPLAGASANLQSCVIFRRRISHMTCNSIDAGDHHAEWQRSEE